MKPQIIRSSFRRLMLAALAVLAAASAAQASVPVPVITLDSASGYTVSYPACPACDAHGLEEYQPATGRWEYVGSGKLAVADRVPGTYRYRTVYVSMGAYGSYYAAYSSAASVTLQAGTQPTPGLAARLATRYEALSGDIDHNGHPDLLLRPVAGAVPAFAADGGAVLVRQWPGAAASSALATAAERTAAAGWARTELEITVRDVNVDGTPDLIIRDLAGQPGFASLANQIVFGPAPSTTGRSLRMRAADTGLAEFSRDINRHIADPYYYPNNAPLRYLAIAYYVPSCTQQALDWWGETSMYLPCFAYISYSYVIYRDYSVFDADAMYVASHDYAMIHGILPSDTGMNRIDSALERILGVAVGGWDVNELLGEEEAVVDTASRRGIDLFVVLAGISEAVAQETDDPAAGAGFDGDRVLLKGRRLLGARGPFHTALEYRGSTVSAYDSDSRILFDGTLVSEVNWVKDRPALTMRLGYVDGPVPAPLYWAGLIAADSRYGDDLPYDLLPSIGQGGYNSNSFVAGLIQATAGRPTVSMSRYIGGERPVPAGEFN